jgi:hypothetical protein
MLAKRSVAADVDDDEMVELAAGAPRDSPVPRTEFRYVSTPTTAGKFDVSESHDVAEDAEEGTQKPTPLKHRVLTRLEVRNRLVKIILARKPRLACCRQKRALVELGHRTLSSASRVLLRRHLTSRLARLDNQVKSIA